MEPKTFLIWTCSFIFAATGIITLLGLINVIKIDKTYLNKLFISLILEIVAIGVLAFRENLVGDGHNPCDSVKTTNNDGNKAWLVTTKIQFFDKNGNLMSNQGGLVQDINIDQISPSLVIVKNEKRVQFMAIGTDKTGRNINLTFNDSKHIFSDFPYNLKSDSIIKIDAINGEIVIPTINLYEPNTTYSKTDTLKSTSNGPKIP